MPEPTGHRAGRVWPYLLIAFLYTATWPFHHGLNNPNEMVRVYLTRALVEHKTMVIDAVIHDWGNVDDKAIRDGKLYWSKAPLASLIGVPTYALIAKLGQRFTPDKRQITTLLRISGAMLPGFLLAAALVAWARRRARDHGRPEREGTAAAIALAFGTMIYPYALTYTGHVVAALAAGGCYLAAAALSKETPLSRRWRVLAVLCGLGGGAAPFAEYPAALTAAPALIAALIVAGRGARPRLEALGWMAVGGLPPFVLGLWAHKASWGSPFKTGYAFLENRSYVEVHGTGFFGVGAPKGVAFLGALFSPGTGLLFFSPVLAVGLAALIAAVLRRRRRAPAVERPDVAFFEAGVHAFAGPPMLAAEGPALEPPQSSVAATSLASSDPEGIATPLATEPRLDAVEPATPVAEPPAPDPALPRALAVAGLLGVIFELLFLSGHNGWRGGWTVGPRYIIPVAPVLGVWVIEALGSKRLRPWIGPLGAASILFTGFAAALYPHLSDVFSNPLRTFLWPSYLRGDFSYGYAYALGLTGTRANLVHVLPLAFAMLYAGLSGGGSGAARLVRLIVVLGVLAGGVALIPEADPAAAQHENQRLWGFWEPRRPGEGPPPGLIFRARDQWLSGFIESIDPAGVARPCRAVEGQANQCSYGDQPWQHYGPEVLDIGGKKEPILFLHPIKGAVVHATYPVPHNAGRAVLRYGLADASVASENTTPIDLRLMRGGRELGRALAANVAGLHALEVSLTSSTSEPLRLEVRCPVDGARVMGFDLELYER